MRYRTGPIAGTLLMTVLALLGIFGLLTAGLGGRSVGSSIFSVVVIAVFCAFAYTGLNELRGVRTEQRPDGTRLLKLPRLIPMPDRWWRTVTADEVETVYLVLVGRRSRLYQLGVTLRDGSTLSTGAVSVNRPRSVHLADTKAGGMVEQILRDLGIAG